MYRLLPLAVLVAAAAMPAAAQSYQSEYKKMMALFGQNKINEGVQHGQRAMELDPKQWAAPFQMGRYLAAIKQFSASERYLSKAWDAYGNGAPPQQLQYRVAILGQRSRVRLWMGETAAGLEDVAAVLKLQPGSPIGHGMEGEFYLQSGEFAKAEAALRKAIANTTATTNRTMPKFTLSYNLAEAIRLQGKDRDAFSAFATARKVTFRENWLALAGQVRIFTLSKDKTIQNRAKARDTIDKVVARFMHNRQQVANADAILSYYEGKYERALSLFRLSEEAVQDVEGIWHHGLTRLKLDDRTGAIKFLSTAAGLWPSYRKALDSDPLLKPLAKEIKARIGDLKSGKSVQERVALREQQDRSRLELAQINDFVRVWKFDLALKDLGKYANSVDAASLKTEVDGRKKLVNRYRKLVDKMIKAVKSGRLKGKQIKIGTTKAKLTFADRKGYRIAIGGGLTRGTWARMGFGDRWNLVSEAGLSSFDWLTLAYLSRDADNLKLAEKALAKAWKDKKRKKQVSEAIAEIRGELIPAGGYALHKSGFVSAVDKKKLDKGLIFFRGSWVTKKDKYHLEKNHEKVNGKWVSLTEDQLEKRGMVKHAGKWVTQSELGAIRGEWASAWTHETEHYRIKTNISMKFAKRLGVALEECQPEFTKFFGKAPGGGDKVLTLAMAKYEDYQKYCSDNNMMNMVNAAGFAMSHRKTIVGYDKIKSKESLMATMLHEAAHCFFGMAYKSARPPSWLAEGMATYFEGAKVSREGNVTFNAASGRRKPQIKAAVNGKTQLTLDEFFTGNALDFINADANKASTFYSQAWAMFYFFHNTIDEKYKSVFQEYFDGIKKGNQPNLKKMLGGDFSKLEADFIKYVKSM